MKCDCPAWCKWVLLIAGILYVAGDLSLSFPGAGMWGIDVWHLLVLLFGIKAVSN